MQELIKSTQRTFWLICFLLIFGCANSGVIHHPQIATQFRTALNDNDVGALVKLTKLPLTVFEQEWESAQDGIGFVLGHRKIHHIEKIDDLKIFYEIFAPRVTIEGNQAISIPPSEYNNFKTEFAGSMDQWRNLKIYLFKRGEGDVEHIVLLGIYPMTHKVQAIYIN